MPRERFSDLNDAIKKGRTGDKITAYKDWRADGAAATYPAPVMPAKGGSVKKALLPFYFGATDFTNFAVVKLSGRAFGALAAVGLSEAKLNFDDIPDTIPPTASYEIVDGLSPAKAVIFLPGTGSTSTKSRVTASNYKKRNGQTYTLPFGKKDLAGKRDQKGMRAQILAGVIAGANVSFKEEIYVP
ncbi:hypothetical protein Q5692_35710 [Microcoleus sp. C2C3]|uniref:hypothetical protein n=1 Tax=unclassified Microcoleus TaxID=2642155 RepID=UPI002FD16C3E